MHLSPPPPPPHWLWLLSVLTYRVVVLLLSIRCWLLLPLWDFVIILCFVVRYFVSILVLPSSRWVRESCLLYFVWLPGVSWLLLALPKDARGCLQFVIVVFPDHTHLLFLTWKYFWRIDKCLIWVWNKRLFMKKNLHLFIPYKIREALSSKQAVVRYEYMYLLQIYCNGHWIL